MEELKLKVEETKNFEPVVVPDNVYSARLADIQPYDEGEYGPAVILDFEITSSEQKGKIVGMMASKKLTEKTKLYDVATKLDRRLKPGEEVNLMGLVGKPCRIVTATKTMVNSNGEKFNRSFVKTVLQANDAQELMAA